jgi:Ca2+-binding EF-hand superfamily protein
MPNPLRLLAAGGLIAILCGPVAAQAPDEPLTRAQLSADLDQSYKRLDSNNDGSFTKAEYLSARAEFEKKAVAELTQMLTAEFNELDANKDKAVVAAEIAAKIPAQGDGKAALARIDGDKNGKISLTEYLAPARNLKASADTDARIRNWDGDGNGQITLAEYKGSALARFDSMDKNRDGKITKDEAEPAASAPAGR